MTSIPPIQPRAKSSLLLKDVLLHHIVSPPRPTAPWDFKRLWFYLNLGRAPFKSSAFYYDFINLLPHPYRLGGNYTRLQARTFIFWYEFSARKYNISFDFGVKQKKTAMENAVWRRSTRRGQKKLTPWWTYLTRYATYNLPPKSFFRLNSNYQQPLFPRDLSAHLPWYEERLPLLRRWAWNHYSRVMPFLSNFAPLSQSVFEEKLLYRRAPLDATTLWLASPVHDYSAFVKSYTDNKSLILPERFFQYRRHCQRRLVIWSQACNRLWQFGEASPAPFNLTAVFRNPLSFYGKVRLFNVASPVAVVRWIFQNLRHLPYRWTSRILPAAKRTRRSKKFVFFYRRYFFLRHLRNRADRHQKILSFFVRYQRPVKQLHRLLAQWFQLFAFSGSLGPQWFLWFLHQLLQQRRIFARKRVVIAQRLLSQSKRKKPYWKKKKFRRPYGKFN